MNWRVKDLLDATGGRLVKGSPSQAVRAISTDTRALAGGDCFVALIGERHDAHDFLGEALARGVGALIVSDEKAGLDAVGSADVAVVAVPDTLRALGALAGYHRRRFSIPVAGITGSNGKTSTKEMVAAILSRRKEVLKNHGNFNNLIGVPLTLLTLEPRHQAAVVEMGINVPGEMAQLVEMSRPSAGLITNIHPAHLEGLHSLDQILEEKGILFKSLQSDGLAAVNLDDERLKCYSRSLGCRRITYSLSDPAADVRLSGRVEVDEGASIFELDLGGSRLAVRLPVLGLHQVQNAVAAAALTLGMGEPLDAIAEGLGEHQPVRQRMQRRDLKDGRVLIDDSYNANPGSMLASVKAVLWAGSGRPVVTVLGEMRELGAEGPALHRELGAQIAALGVSRVIALGELGEEIVRGARGAGMSESSCRHASSHAEALEHLAHMCPAGAWIVVKGSRAMAMERIVEGILENE